MNSKWDALVEGNRSPLVIYVSIAMVVVPTISLALRFWSRAVAQRTGYWWDDWLCLFAWAISVGQSALLIYAATYLGLGKHMMVVYVHDPERIVRFIKGVYAGYYLFITGVTAVKVSALLFYARVFRPYASDRAFRIPYIITFTIVILWFVAALVMLLIDCRPIQGVWNQTIPGRHCVNRYQSYMANAISDSITDLMVLLLPMPWLWKLNITKSRKALVLGVFFVGYCALLCSLGRTATIALQGPTFAIDFTWNSVPTLLWGCLSTPIGIFSICLPSIFYLVKHAKKHGFRALFTAKVQYEQRLSGSLDGGGLRSERSDNSRTSRSSYPKAGEALVVQEMEDDEKSAGSPGGSSRGSVSKDGSVVGLRDRDPELGEITVETRFRVEEEYEEDAREFWRKELLDGSRCSSVKSPSRL